MLLKYPYRMASPPKTTGGCPTRERALASMYNGVVPMKYCPYPGLARPVSQPLGLVPIGRR